MTITTLQQAAIQRIKDNAGGTPVTYPNRAATTSLPRYVVQVGPGSNRTITLGGDTDRTQEIIVLVETAPGVYATESDTLVQALINAFPVNQKVGGGYVPTLPNPRPPMDNADAYTVPVIIPLRAFF